VKRLVLVLAAGYVAVAAANRAAERFGLMSCGCADDCGCHRPGLSLFRWVFPWGHRSAHDADEKSALDVLAG